MHVHVCVHLCVMVQKGLFTTHVQEFIKLVLLSLLGFQGLSSDPYAFLASALPAEPSHSPPPALILPPIGYLVNTDCYNWKELVGT